MKETPRHWHCVICGAEIEEPDALALYAICKYHQKAIVEAWMKKAKAP